MARHLKEKNKIKIKKWKIIAFSIFLIIFLFAFINLLRWFIYNKKTDNLIDNMIEIGFSNQSENTENVENPINFENLKNINSDVVGWIKIENTEINYPIVKTTDNDYYLHRDINKEYNTCGWIFMDYKNSKDFIDKNTVIYGHNIKSGLMFEPLQKIINNELGNNIIIEIYTETEKLNYKVFSSYIEEPEDYAIKSNIVTEEEQSKYITEMLKRSSISYNLVPDKSDKLLTLSTCDNTGNKRILVHSVYIGGEKYNKK